MKRTSKRVFSVLIVASIAILVSAWGPSSAPFHIATASAATPGWLDRFNTWRAISAVPSVTENTTWSAGDAAHAKYMVKNDLVTHYETPGVPYYTDAGNIAAQNSNINVSSTTSSTDENAIDWWMGAPFHAMAMMDPRLKSTGFGSYREIKSGWQMGAAVDIGRGNSYTGGTYPVFFPGNGTTEPLTTYSGNEFPDPLPACSGYGPTTGLPVFVEVGGGVSTKISSVHSFTGNGVPLAHCIEDSTTANVGSYLTNRGAALLIPKAPLVAGVRYVVSLIVNSKPYAWSFTVGPFSTFDPLACTSVNETASPVSPQAPGGTITFTASAAGSPGGCASPEYKFFLHTASGWTAQTSYGGPTWAWNTTGLAGGVYGVGVWARQAGSLAAYETYWLGTFTLKVGTCTSAAITTGTSSPQAPGASITFMASATRCASAQFKFWVLPKGGSWTMTRDWGANTWTWNTNGLAAGTYELGVWARQPGTPNQYDAFGFTTFALGSGNCISAGVSASVAAPQAPGTPIVISGSSNGCTSPQYQFWLMAPGGAFVVKQAFSADATWSWDTTGYAPGTYQVGVWAKQSGSSAAYDAFNISTYRLDVGSCTAATISASPTLPQTVGTSITFTVSSTDCGTPQFEFWRVSGLGTKWSVVQAYGSETTLVWDTTGLAPGAYRFGVWARQSGSGNSYDTYSQTTFWVSS